MLYTLQQKGSFGTKIFVPKDSHFVPKNLLGLKKVVPSSFQQHCAKRYIGTKITISSQKISFRTKLKETIWTRSNENFFYHGWIRYKVLILVCYSYSKSKKLCILIIQNLFIQKINLYNLIIPIISYQKINHYINTI